MKKVFFVFLFLLFAGLGVCDAQIYFSVTNQGGYPMSTNGQGVSSELMFVNSRGDLEWVASCYPGYENEEGCTDGGGVGWYYSRKVWTGDGSYILTPLEPGMYYLNVWAQGTLVFKKKVVYNGWGHVEVTLEFSPVRAKVRRSMVDLPEDGGSFRSEIDLSTSTYDGDREVVVSWIVLGTAENWFQTHHALGNDEIVIAKKTRKRVYSLPVEIGVDIPTGGWVCIQGQIHDPENPAIVFATTETCGRKVAGQRHIQR